VPVARTDAIYGTPKPPCQARNDAVVKIAGPSARNWQSRATAIAVRSPAIGLSDLGVSYPAQHESFFTSLLKAWAANFRPSTVVR
jgi:hypothetical protein